MHRLRSRFECSSSGLRTQPLLAGNGRRVWIGLVVTLGFHLGLAHVRALGTSRPAARPLSTRFVKREPRLTKPLELKKRPQPKRRAVHRKMI